MVLHYHYQETPTPNGKKVHRPVIPVTFGNGEQALDTMALLDSGADICAMSKDMAEVLELDLSGPREKCYGVTGSAESVLTFVQVTVAKGHERYNMRVPVKVLLIEDTMIPLLG
jgi:hypothetical protein